MKLVSFEHQSPGHASGFGTNTWYPRPLTVVAHNDFESDNELYFNGVNSYGFINSLISLTHNTNWTVELKYKGYDDISYTTHHGLGLLARDASDIYANIQLINGYFEYLHYTSSWQHNLQSTTKVTDGNWHHLVVSHASNITASIYVDGNLEASGSSAIGNTSYPMRIGLIMHGRLGGYVRPTQGCIKDVRIWNTTRTQQEILDNMNIELTGTESGLIHHWKCDKVEGNIFRNSVTNNPFYVMNVSPKYKLFKTDGYRFTLQPGRYFFDGFFNTYYSGYYVVRLYNLTKDEEVSRSVIGYARAASSVGAFPIRMSDMMIIETPCEFEIQQINQDNTYLNYTNGIASVNGMNGEYPFTHSRINFYRDDEYHV